MASPAGAAIIGVLRILLYIPLVLGVVGSAVLGVHVTTSLGIEGDAQRAFFVIFALGAGIATAHRFDKPSRLGLFNAAVLGVFLLVVTLGNWLDGGHELINGWSGPAPLLLATFVGGLIGSRLSSSGGAHAAAHAATVVLVALAFQGFTDTWPAPWWLAVSTIAGALFVTFACGHLEPSGPSVTTLVGGWIGALAAFMPLSGEPLGFLGLVVISGSMFMVVCLIALVASLLVGFLEGISNDAPRTKPKLPLARLLSRRGRSPE